MEESKEDGGTFAFFIILLELYILNARLLLRRDRMLKFASKFEVADVGVEKMLQFMVF